MNFGTVHPCSKFGGALTYFIHSFIYYSPYQTNQPTGTSHKQPFLMVLGGENCFGFPAFFALSHFYQLPNCPIAPAISLVLEAGPMGSFAEGSWASCTSTHLHVPPHRIVHIGASSHEEACTRALIQACVTPLKCLCPSVSVEYNKDCPGTV